MTVLLENKQCLLRFYKIMRSRIGLVADPSSAESGVRVEGRLTSLATTPTVGESATLLSGWVPVLSETLLAERKH